MSPSRELPGKQRLARIAVGLLAAIAAPLALFVILVFGEAGLRDGLFIAAYIGVIVVLSTVVFGLPMIFLLRNEQVSGPFAALVGSCVASAPWALAAAIASPGFLILLFFSVPLGAVGGLVFWAFGLSPPRHRG